MIIKSVRNGIWIESHPRVTHQQSHIAFLHAKNTLTKEVLVLGLGICSFCQN